LETLNLAERDKAKKKNRNMNDVLMERSLRWTKDPHHQIIYHQQNDKLGNFFDHFNNTIKSHSLLHSVKIKSMSKLALCTIHLPS
jgi:hypothetical protein